METSKSFSCPLVKYRGRYSPVGQSDTGIDVGAKAEIYKLILKLADAGKTILINTLEIPELAKVADCCAVFYEGTIIKMLQHEEIDEKQ